MAIGRAIRDGWFATSIGNYILDHDSKSDFMIPRVLLPGSCLSAATLLYLGGKLRYFPIGSRFGVHQFSFRNPIPDYISQSQILSARIAQYVFDMGISANFLEVSSSTKSDTVKLLEEDDLRALRVTTGGETNAVWSVQALGGMIYVRGERDSLFGHHKLLLSYVKPPGFMLWAVIKSQGRETELTTFPLVEIPVNGEETVIDVSTRSSRVVNGIYVIVMADLSKEEAGLIARSTSFGCRIRGSKEAPVFLGVSEMSTEGGTEQLGSLYSAFSD